MTFEGTNWGRLIILIKTFKALYPKEFKRTILAMRLGDFSVEEDVAPIEKNLMKFITDFNRLLMKKVQEHETVH